VRVAGESQTPSPSERAELMERVLGLASTAATGAPGWFVLAGSLPPAVDPGFYCELATLVTAAGARVALDTGGEPLGTHCWRGSSRRGSDGSNSPSWPGLPAASPWRRLRGGRWRSG
jgi:hypothetical protein